MLKITARATDHLLRVRQEKGLDADAIPRFVRRAGRLALTWSREPGARDRIVDAERVRTFVAPSAADLLDGKTIDVKAGDDQRWGLIVRAPRTRRASGAPQTSTIRHDRPAGATG